jgi:crotonobetainyl-CoA:carnitine CoA-transferase CaiB-like acyl-CoA transferase
MYCAVSGYSRDGPDGDKPGFDLIAQGFSGLMSIAGDALAQRRFPCALIPRLIS